MFRLLLISAVSAVALTGCDDGGVRISSRTTGEDAGVMKVVDALQCPDTLGALTRKGSASGDGLVCNYTGPRGAEVSLHLVRLDGQSVDEVLAGFETRLAADLPEAAARVNAETARADADAARAEADRARAEADQARVEADAALVEADAARDTAGEAASVTAPGVRIVAQDDKASVRLPGIRIEAEGDKANVQIGGMHIKASDGQGVQTTTSSVSVNATDEATEVRATAPGEAVRAHYILTDGQPRPGGWALVGYEARGPRGGPIVVATVRAKEGNRDRIFDDARDLVTLNVGQ